MKHAVVEIWFIFIFTFKFLKYPILGWQKYSNMLPISAVTKFQAFFGEIKSSTNEDEEWKLIDANDIHMLVNLLPLNVASSIVLWDLGI